jgi:acyl-CoA synthetase (AMP-forming)/AMP-acid ligase II
MTEATTHANDEPIATLLDGGEAGRTALVAPEDGQPLTYAQLASRVETLAGRLAAAGVRRGDRVALALPNGPEVVQLLLAIAVAGAAAAPLNPAYTANEFAFHLGDLEPRLLVLPAGELAAARAAAASCTAIVDLVMHGAEPPELAVDGEVVGRGAAFEAGGPDDVALLLHTSGTTSRPKQVPLLQRNLMASSRTIARNYLLGGEDVSFCAMPLFHVHGLVASAFSTLIAGGTVVVPRRFSPRRFWQQAREHGVTWLSAGPTLHRMILEKIDDEGAPGTLRFVRSCSSALSPSLLKRAEEVYAAPMLEAYGMTEASHQMASNPLPPSRRVPGSVGVATGTEVRVVDRRLRFLEEGSTGEVVVRGPGLTPGYRNNPEANAEAFFDGWFRTGDRGVLEDGYLRLEGRLKEMIIRGGENISPAEIEDVLISHPAVADAVCFGVEDEKYGEAVVAAVVLSGEVTEELLRAHCRERLTAVKVPRTIHILPHIPRTPTGKLQRRRMATFIEQRDPPR